jgi:hypothetical protein
MMTDIATSPTTAIALIAAVSQELMQIEEQNLEDEQRMRLLINADSMRLDFYEIRSQKNDNVRRIIINNKAEIIFDSEDKVKRDSASEVPEFDEIDTKFLKVIPDTGAGRDYYRTLRGLQSLPKIPRDLPSYEREQMRRIFSDDAKEEARQLRQAVVDNFREQDHIERQSEMNEIFLRRELRAQEEMDLQTRKEKLQLALVELHKERRQEELKRKQELEENDEMKRKEGFARKRNAWLDRLSSRTHTGNEKTAEDAEEFNFIDRDPSQQSQGKEKCCMESGATTHFHDGKKTDENAMDGEDVEEQFESEDGEDQFESDMSPLVRSSSKNESARSDASTCSFHEVFHPTDGEDDLNDFESCVDASPCNF